LSDESTPLDANWGADALQALLSMVPWVGTPASSIVASARTSKANAYVLMRLKEIDEELRAVGGPGLQQARTDWGAQVFRMPGPFDAVEKADLVMAGLQRALNN